MTTLYGGETHGPNDEFKPVDGEALTADMFNYATSFWVADDVPDETEGKDGDVVFVIGDSPVGDSGELPGLGGWAEITDVSGSPKRYAYNDGIDWVAFEWTGDGSVTTTDGLMDSLVVGGGSGGGGTSTGNDGAGGTVIPAISLIPNGLHNIKVGVGGNGASHGTGNGRGGTDSFLEPQSYGGPGAANGLGGQNWNAGQHNVSSLPYGTGFTTSILDGNPATYGAGGYDNLTPEPNSGQGGRNSQGSGGQRGADGIVIVRVPAAQAEKVSSDKWVTRSNHFAVVENGVVTETYTEHHYGNGTITPLPQTDLIPCDANVTEGYAYENGEFVAPVPEIPAAQQEILDKIDKLQQELRSYDG